MNFTKTNERLQILDPQLSSIYFIDQSQCFMQQFPYLGKYQTDPIFTSDRMISIVKFP